MRTNRQNKLIVIFILLFVISFFSNYIYATDSELKIYSDAALIIENKTGKVLYEKNSEQKMYPASTTKILTAIITIEKGKLQDKTTVSKSAIAEMKSGYTSAYLVEGEVLTIEELLEVLLVHSANDAANVLAEYISGSIPKFVDLMNTKLQELGCKNTHFVTTNGLHDDDHYTTAKDIATIARYCMQNKDFRRIVSMPNCHINATNKSGERIFKNTNDLINKTSIYFYPGCIGIKTGFTSQAKNCLISACSKNGLDTIAVVFGASLTDNRKSARYVDSISLYDYVYNNYTYKDIAKAYTVLKTIEVKDGTKETKKLDLNIQDNIKVLAKKEDNENILPEILINEDIKAPIAKNAVLGKAIYTIDGTTYTSNLLASHNVEKNDSLIKNLRIVLVFLILVLFIIIIISVWKYLKRKNLMEATK